MKRMKSKLPNNIVVFDTMETLTAATADFIIEQAAHAMNNHGRFTLVLSGGNTPSALYSLLSTPAYRNKMPWKNTFIFWGDERFVPLDNKWSNAGNAYSLLLNHIEIPPGNIYPVAVNTSPHRAALDYESMVKSFFGKEAPRFDLVLLGLGEDGHTASLFPGSDVVFEKERLVKEVYATEKKMYRITMTPVLINQAHAIVFLVAGSGKAEILRVVTADEKYPERFPAQIIAPQDGTLRWFADKKAAALLPADAIHDSEIH